MNLLFNSCVVYFSRNSFVVFRHFCAYDGITVKESNHEFTEKHEYNHGSPEVSKAPMDIEISGLHPVELPVKILSPKILIASKVPP